MAKVIFSKSGVEAEWDGTFDNVLELAEDKGIDLDFGCRAGNCTACQQKVVSGSVTYPQGRTGEPEPGNELLCCCQPAGSDDLVVEV